MCMRDHKPEGLAYERVLGWSPMASVFKFTLTPSSLLNGTPWLKLPTLRQAEEEGASGQTKLDLPFSSQEMLNHITYNFPVIIVSHISYLFNVF